MKYQVNREWVNDWMKRKKTKYGSDIREERINFLFLKGGSMIYPYDYFNGCIDAMIDAIEQGENIDELISLVFPEKVDHPIVKEKLLTLMNK